MVRSMAKMQPKILGQHGSINDPKTKKKSTKSKMRSEKDALDVDLKFILTGFWPLSYLTLPGCPRR